MFCIMLMLFARITYFVPNISAPWKNYRGNITSDTIIESAMDKLGGRYRNSS
jgi:hypothetical protein